MISAEWSGICSRYPMGGMDVAAHTHSRELGLMIPWDESLLAAHVVPVKFLELWK